MELVSFFLVFLAIVLIGVAVLLGTGLAPKVFRSAPRRYGGPSRTASTSPWRPCLPVLLPEDAAPSDIDRLRFAVGLRGYRMDQVDQVLDELRDQMAPRTERSRTLGEEVGRLRHAAGPGR